MPIDRFSSDDQMTTIIVDADHDQPDQTVSLSITDADATLAAPAIFCAAMTSLSIFYRLTVNG